MATLRTDRIGPPSGLHDRRVLSWLRSRGSDALGGHAVFCAAALPGGHAAGRRLGELLPRDVDLFHLAVEPSDPPAELARQLDAMLAGVSPARSLGAAAREEFLRGAELVEPTLGAGVRPGDVVVLHDSFAFSLAPALRDRGAHAVWHLRRATGSQAPHVSEALDFLDRAGGGAVDAVVIDEWMDDDGPARVAALVPAARLLDIREVSPGRDAVRAERLALAWISLLGDILEEDRADHVGGTIHVRPIVAAR